MVISQRGLADRVSESRTKEAQPFTVTLDWGAAVLRPYQDECVTQVVALRCG